MILRRIKAHIEKENWFAVFVDFIIVVVGVFIGIQVANWNDSRTNQYTELAAIKRLVIEHSENLIQLDRDKNAHLRSITAIEKLLAMAGPEPQVENDDKVMGQLLLDALTNPTFGARMESTRSLITSGEIRLLAGNDLQVALTQWPALADEVLEWQVIERAHTEETVAGLTYEYIAWPDVEVALAISEKSSAFESNYAGLLSSRQFEGLINNRRWNLRYIVTKIEILEEKTKTLLEQLKSRQKVIQ